MAEYIDREVLIAEFKRMKLGENCFIERVFADGVAPVVHGKWLDNVDYMFCSKCGMKWNYYDNDTQDFKYCPSCGAKMDGGDDDATNGNV